MASWNSDTARPLSFLLPSPKPRLRVASTSLLGIRWGTILMSVVEMKDLW